MNKYQFWTIMSLTQISIAIILRRGSLVVLFLFSTLFVPGLVQAATLGVSPATGVYFTGSVFTVSLLVNTTGASVNAADGTLNFNPRELSVVSVSRANSIFNLWTAEPSFSNSAGTISFSGGVPTGYTGGNGTVITVTFRALTSGAVRVQTTSGSVLAADGRGTNVLTNMSGGTYTLSAVETQPTPEVIVEYVALANTPAVPVVTSTTHPDQSDWYQASNAALSWSLPAGVIAIRTLLNASSVSVPTKVYEEPLKNITLSDLAEGVSYFHIQFKNAAGWGKVAHYRLAKDSVKPESFKLSLPETADLSNPTQVVLLDAADATSPVLRFNVHVDAGNLLEFIATTTPAQLQLPLLEPGNHVVTAEAFDQAGNSIISTLHLTILAFDKPVFTEYPTSLSAGVIPVLKGTTKPNASVEITVTHPTGLVSTASVKSDGTGTFIFIPEAALTQGVYKITAVAVDTLGAKSDTSDEIKIAVRVAGYIAIGTWLVSVISVIIPLVALVLFGWVGVIYAFSRIRKLRGRVLIESGEATNMAIHEFALIRAVLARHETALTATRKSQKLTTAEIALINDIRNVVDTAEQRVEKEVADVTLAAQRL